MIHTFLVNIIVANKKPLPIIKKKMSTPSPPKMFADKDNKILDYLPDSFLDQIKAIQYHENNPSYLGNYRFMLSLKDTYLGMDGGPKNKIVGMSPNQILI